MRLSVCRTGALAVLCVLSACADERSSADTQGMVRPQDMRLQRISNNEDAWRIHDGGAASQKGGMVIDLADGGIMRRDIRREVREDTGVKLVMRVDANGDQSLEIVLAGGCGRDPVGGLVSEQFNLKNGFNRIELTNRFEAPYDCFFVELNATNGPVSMFIEDAVLNWSQ